MAINEFHGIVCTVNGAVRTPPGKTVDIVAKHIPADKDGVRIAELDEQSYREKMWSHRPLTDFWRVGKGWSDYTTRS